MASLLFDSDIKGLVFNIEESLKEHVAKRMAILGVSDQQPCRFFQKGSCMKGEKCAFRHVKSDKSTVCKHWLRGLCKKNDFCEFLHEYDLSRMPTCQFFSAAGACSNEDCLFLHIKPGEKKKNCPYYDRGFCKHGPNCHNNHVKRIACPDYLAGFCKLGPECKLGHPKFEAIDEFTGTKLLRGIPVCARCGQPGHVVQQCTTEFDKLTIVPPLETENKKPRAHLRSVTEVTCFKCGEKGHYANVCPNKRRAPPAGGYQLPGVKIVNPLERKYSGGGLPTGSIRRPPLGYPPGPASAASAGVPTPQISFPAQYPPSNSQLPPSSASPMPLD